MKKIFTILAVLSTLCLSGTMLSAQDDWRPYLTKEVLPDGSQYLPAPPDTASMRFFNDWYQYNWGKSVRDTPRGALAARQADDEPDDFAEFFSVPFGMEITREGTPCIYEMIYRTVDAAAEGTSKAKHHYMRKRPFVQFNEGTLVPEAEESHRRTGSFPSSHSAMGWSAALVLVEINPERQEEILKLGYEYGQSRVIAGYHYQSDVDAARFAAAACVARLHADPTFLKDMEKAKKEFRKLSQKK
ncbi:MAG: phosphatase PAP2 family protein [Bacteroidales bacterium]|nr:phosphatase PAP2 family protein [Bacteroidales bacterium]